MDATMYYVSSLMYLILAIIFEEVTPAKTEDMRYHHELNSLDQCSTIVLLNSETLPSGTDD